MIQLFTKRLFLLLLITVTSFKTISAQAVYETVSSGNWSDLNIWRSWSSGVIGVGTGVSPTLNVPSGTHKVVIHSGHTVSMNAANRSCHGLIIENGGKLWANQVGPLRLQVGTGGTGFLYPVNDTLQNDGVLGGAGDGLYIETGTNAQNITITGSGSFDILRIRTPGGNGSAAGGVMNLLIDANINLYQASNYALTAVYNPTLTDNYSITINAGKTVKLMDVAGYFHNSASSSTYGNYTYNIKGTLDLSANMQTASNVSANIAPPAPAASAITINVDGGILKTGSAFKADTVTASAGILSMNVINGGTIDASNTSILQLGKTSDGAGGYRDLFFGLDATGTIQQTVGPNEVKFPIGLNTALTPNNAYLINSGTSDIFSVGLKNTFDNALADPSKVVPRQWDIKEANTGANVTVMLSWLTADQPVNFNPANQVYTIHYLGSWTETAATVTGSGTAADPYISSTSGYTSFSPFGVDNQAGVIVPITLLNIRAYQQGSSVQVEWSNATELNINNYVVERSTDGVNFVAIGSTTSKTNNGSLNSYTWPDAIPANGINYYRIKSIGKNLDIKYSTIAKVNLASGNSSIAIYPNPVKGGIINLQLTGMPKGKYSLRLIDDNGRMITSGTINHAGGSSTQSINLNKTFAAGLYILEIIHPDNSETNLRLVSQ